MSDANVLVTNEFGTVYPDRIAFYSQKGWFSGGALEELPFRHVTSVRIETNRSVVLGIVLALIGLLCLTAKGAGVLIGLVLLVIAALILWGSPSVRVNTAGGDLRPARGFPWQRDAAEAFVGGVRKALFAKEEARG